MVLWLAERFPSSDILTAVKRWDETNMFASVGAGEEKFSKARGGAWSFIIIVIVGHTFLFHQDPDKNN